MSLHVCPCLRLKDVAGASLAGFGIGAVGTIVGTLVAWHFFGSQMGPDGYKVDLLLASCTFGSHAAVVEQILRRAHRVRADHSLLRLFKRSAHFGLMDSSSHVIDKPTDAALIVCCMSLLHSGRCNIWCVTVPLKVSSGMRQARFSRNAGKLRRTPSCSTSRPKRAFGRAYD